MIIKMMSNCE